MALRRCEPDGAQRVLARALAGGGRGDAHFGAAAVVQLPQRTLRHTGGRLLKRLSCVRLPRGLLRRAVSIVVVVLVARLAGVRPAVVLVLLRVPSLGRIELNDTPHLLLLLHHLNVVQTIHNWRLGRRVVNLLWARVYVEVGGGSVDGGGVSSRGCWGQGGGLQLSLMLWDLREILLGLPRVAEADRLDKVRVLDVAVRTGDHVAVVAVEVQSFHRVQQQFVAGVALREEIQREMEARILLLL